MNLKEIWEKQFFKATKIAGIDIQINQDNTYCCAYVVLKRNGNKLSIVTSKDGINSLEELLKEIAKVNCPLVLSINGKGIIYKNLNEKFNSTYQDALQKVFPTGNEAEFHVQLFHGFSDNVFIAVIRKEILNEIIS